MTKALLKIKKQKLGERSALAETSPDSSYPFEFATVNARIGGRPGPSSEPVKAQRGIALVQTAIAQQRSEAVSGIELLFVFGGDDG